MFKGTVSFFISLKKGRFVLCFVNRKKIEDAASLKMSKAWCTKGQNFKSLRNAKDSADFRGEQRRKIPRQLLLGEEGFQGV